MISFVWEDSGSNLAMLNANTSVCMLRNKIFTISGEIMYSHSNQQNHGGPKKALWVGGWVCCLLNHKLPWKNLQFQDIILPK